MENTIKGGTLRGLVIAATSHEGRGKLHFDCQLPAFAQTDSFSVFFRTVDSSYLSAFLMTYRTFCTGHQLLDQLVERYLASVPEGLEEKEFQEWESQKLRPIRAR
jgi:son of sevenless-like protein